MSGTKGKGERPSIYSPTTILEVYSYVVFAVLISSFVSLSFHLLL